MRIRTVILMLAVLAMAGGTATVGAMPMPQAGVAVDVGLFYDALAPYGSWVTVATYGDVWVPDVPPWWRPYTDGQWVYTDEGWSWADAEPWGWAPFHYGRWYFDPEYGWAWVPGSEWAPAWVAWRVGDGYIGWAPLPPEVRWNVRLGLSFGGVDLDARIGRHAWCFVDERHMTAPGLREYVAPSARNVTFLRDTRDVTRFTVVRGRVFDHGVDVRHIERVTGRPLPVLRVVDSESPRAVRVTGRDLTVYRPSPAARDGRWRGPAPRAERNVPGHGERLGVPPEQLQRRAVEEQRQFAAHQAEERARLQRLHAEELSQARGRRLQEIQRQHQAEQQAFTREQERERQVLEHRIQHAPPPAPRQVGPKTRPKPRHEPPHHGPG